MDTLTEQPAQSVTEGQAFDRLYADYAAQVRRVVRRHLWGSVVDDVVQETFVQAYRSGLHLDLQHDVDGDLAVWKRLAGIARNRSIDVLRRRMRGREEIADDGRLFLVPSTSPDWDPEHRLLASRRREGIAEVLNSLCERQRRVLFMRHVDGRSYDEIAKAEDISVDAVKAALARGRRTFRHLYASVAERQGLSAVLGGRLLGRLQALFRRARERATSVAETAVSGLAAASPGVTNALVTAVVVGGIAIVGAGTAAAQEPEPAQPSSHTSAAPGEEESHAGEEGENPEGSEPEPEERSEPAKPAPSDDHRAEPAPQPDSRPGPGPTASHQTSTSVDSEEVAPGGDQPAKAKANAGGSVEADGDEGRAQSGQEGSADTETDGSEASYEVAGVVKVGCFEPDGPVTSVVCPLLP